MMIDYLRGKDLQKWKTNHLSKLPPRRRERYLMQLFVNIVTEAHKQMIEDYLYGKYSIGIKTNIDFSKLEDTSDSSI